MKKRLFLIPLLLLACVILALSVLSVSTRSQTDVPIAGTRNISITAAPAHLPAVSAGTLENRTTITRFLAGRSWIITPATGESFHPGFVMRATLVGKPMNGSRIGASTLPAIGAMLASANRPWCVCHRWY